jgi:hypothetical protein
MSSSQYKVNDTLYGYDSESVSKYTGVDHEHNSHMHHINHLLAEKITKDIIYTMGNSKNKPDFNPKEYSKDLIKDISLHQFENISIAGVAYIAGESVIIPLKLTYATADFSSCMTHEITYLIDKGIYFNDNHNIAKNICVIKTLNSTFGGELKLIGNITGTALSTSAEVYLEKTYLDAPLEHGGQNSCILVFTSLPP